MTTLPPPRSLQAVINVDPEIMGGEPVFMGTRVPIEIFWAYLEDNAPLDEFLLDYPTVTREQCLALLESAREKVLADARAA
ncbi:MAG: DUF433 domain-containing protein [Phycisphaerales bacterium]|nr:DUF433 domain-containing protein [Phycisphaerales bacterium]